MKREWGSFQSIEIENIAFLLVDVGVFFLVNFIRFFFSVLLKK